MYSWSSTPGRQRYENQEFRASSSLSYVGLSFNSDDDDDAKNLTCTSVTLLKSKDCIRGTI